MNKPRSSSMVLDVGAASVRHLAGALAGLLVIPLIARTLGPEALGAWALVGTASFVLGVSDLGLSTCVQRAVAAGDDEEARQNLGFALGTIAVVAPLLGAAFWWLLGGTLRAGLGADTRPVLLLTLGAGLLSAFAFPYRALLLVRGGMRRLATARGLASFIQVGMTFALLRLSRSLVSPALALLLSAAFETSATVLFALASDRALPLLPRLPRSGAHAASALREGAATLVINVAFLAAQRADLLILARVESLGVLAAYGVAGRAVDQAYVLAKQVSAALLPRLARAEDRKAAVQLGTTAMGILVASGMPALALDGQPLLVLWGGSSAAGGVTASVAALLGAAAVIAATQEVAASALTVAGKTAWETALSLLCGTTANVALSLLFAGRYGVWSVAGATVVGNAVTSLLIWHRAARLLGFRARDVLTLLAPPLLAALGSSLAALALAGYAARSPASSCLSVLLSSAAGLLAGGAWAGRKGRLGARASGAPALLVAQRLEP